MFSFSKQRVHVLLIPIVIVFCSGWKITFELGSLMFVIERRPPVIGTNSKIILPILKISLEHILI